jgi:uncharacterized protein (TIGR00288 family)
MNNDIAVFLDLDNLVIGAGEAELTFDINLVLVHLQASTQGRIVLRRAYGDWRQKAELTKELAAAGFELQSAVRLSSNSKNLADMQMTVEAMSTLIDRQNFETYVLVTGDRDFAPLVQALQKRGKLVIGVGIQHATSTALANLCDRYIYYDELADSARKMLEEQLEELLDRALDQLLQEKDRVAASLLKQRMQALSKGAFGRSPQGKRNFRKLLAEYPEQAELQQVGTTLYVFRPGAGAADDLDSDKKRRPLPEEEIRHFLQQALKELTVEEDKIRASLLKQRMRELSDEAFDEVLQGDKTFRRFLDRYPEIVAVELEGSTLYAGAAREEESEGFVRITEEFTREDAEALLGQALDALLVDQNRVRASLLKQEMQGLSGGVFDESVFGYDNFRQFLRGFPTTVRIQQKGTTLLVFKPDQDAEPEDLHLRYRSGLKKHGLRVIPPETRMLILKNLVSYLNSQGEMPWRDLVNALSDHYHEHGRNDISKSYINDVLRVARRADVVDVGNGGTLSYAPVKLSISGDRLFQNAVMQCDATYLRQIISLPEPFDWEEAALALYDTPIRVRYLQVIHNRFSGVTPEQAEALNPGVASG